MNEIEIKKVIDNIGSNPGTLEDLGIHMQKGLSLDHFITMTLHFARSELVAFQHQQILKALKDHPEGISPEVFIKLKNKGVDLLAPRVVGVVMSRGNAITYRIELNKHTTYSKAVEVALRSYNPILPAVWSLTSED